MSPETRAETEHRREYASHTQAHHTHGHLAEPERSYNSKAVAAFVLGLGGFIVPLIPSLLAVVFGHSARDDLRMDHAQKGDGLALTGLILGYVGLALAVIVVMALTFMF